MVPTQLDSTATCLLFVSDFKGTWNLYTNFGTLVNREFDVMLLSGGVRLFVTLAGARNSEFCNILLRTVQLLFFYPYSQHTASSLQTLIG